MASGKSSVGLRVSQLLRLPFVDLDVRIEEMTGSSVSRIFDEFGEGAFRRFESAALARTLADGDQVIAVGGGAVMDDHNWDLIREGNLVVRLAVSSSELMRRLGAGEGRPLAATAPDLDLAGDAEARGRLLALLEAREPRYLEAEVQLDTSNQSIEEVSAVVAERARAAGLGRSPIDG